MIMPTIHRNGTSASVLLEQAREACDAARGLLKALIKADPNGRDYYLRDGAFEVARREHEARFRAVGDVLRDMEALAEHCHGAL